LFEVGGLGPKRGTDKTEVTRNGTTRKKNCGYGNCPVERMRGKMKR